MSDHLARGVGGSVAEPPHIGRRRCGINPAHGRCGERRVKAGLPFLDQHRGRDPTFDPAPPMLLTRLFADAIRDLPRQANRGRPARIGRVIGLAGERAATRSPRSSSRARPGAAQTPSPAPSTMQRAPQRRLRPHPAGGGRTDQADLFGSDADRPAGTRRFAEAQGGTLLIQGSSGCRRKHQPHSFCAFRRARVEPVGARPRVRGPTSRRSSRRRSADLARPRAAGRFSARISSTACTSLPIGFGAVARPLATTCPTSRPQLLARIAVDEGKPIAELRRRPAPSSGRTTGRATCASSRTRLPCRDPRRGPVLTPSPNSRRSRPESAGLPVEIPPVPARAPARKARASERHCAARSARPQPPRRIRRHVRRSPSSRRRSSASLLTITAAACPRFRGGSASAARRSTEN